MTTTCTLGPIQTKRFRTSKRYRNTIIEKIVLISLKDRRDTFIKASNGNIIATVFAPRIFLDPLPV